MLQGVRRPRRGPRGAAGSEELRHRVRQRRWYAEGAGEVSEPADLEELRAALEEDDAALVAHLVVDDRVTALVVRARPVRRGRPRPAGPAARPARRPHLRPHDGRGPPRRPARRSPSGPALRARLGVVAEQLVAPLADLLGERRLVLTPSGGLAGTPWTLLPGLVGRPLTIPPSATRWLELRGAPGPGRSGWSPARTSPAGPRRSARAATAWPDAQVLRGDDGHHRRGSPSWPSRSTCCTSPATAGTPGENPLFSAVELVDGPWFGYDIDELRRTPSTVVLSACELGRVSVRSGEEAIGMSAAWLHAGARTVLSSPVLIADDVACDAMARWHALVAAGAAPADALAQVSAEADDVVPMLSFGGGW